MLKLLLAMGGGAIGAGLRYGVYLATLKATTRFPLGTLTVNVVGCLLIGFFFAWFNSQHVREEYRVLILVGILGGFTTFSAFGNDTLQLLSKGQPQLAILNVVANNGLGLLAAWLGYLAAGRLASS